MIPTENTFSRTQIIECLQLRAKDKEMRILKLTHQEKNYPLKTPL